MKHPIITSLGLAVLASVSLVTPASATLNIDYVPVGNAGNAADTADGDAYTSGVQRYGAVSYAYQIAKNETTISQYAVFLNAVAKTDTYSLYNASMTNSEINGISRSGSSSSYSYSVNPGSGNKPITYVSWFDAARFCNWVQNGQGSGGTETGAYTLNGAMSGIYTKNAGATTWIPSENEWYKAAYYDPNKGGAGVGGYWPYSTLSNTLAGNTIGVANSVNYNDGDFASSPGRLTDVGAYGANSDSFYGTNDQSGNVYEWNDTVEAVLYRGLRGGSWYFNANLLDSSSRDYNSPTGEGNLGGFRVASSELAAIPEVTSSFTMLGLITSGLLLRRRTKTLR